MHLCIVCARRAGPLRRFIGYLVYRTSNFICRPILIYYYAYMTCSLYGRCEIFHRNRDFLGNLTYLQLRWCLDSHLKDDFHGLCLIFLQYGVHEWNMDMSLNHDAVCCQSSRAWCANDSICIYASFAHVVREDCADLLDIWYIEHQILYVVPY